MVRFTRLDVTLAADNVTTDLSVSPREPVTDAPNRTLAVLDVTTHRGSSADIASETVRVSVAPDSLPAGATLSDVVLYGYRNGEWQQVHSSLDGSSFSATVSGVSPVGVGIRSGTVSSGYANETLTGVNGTTGTTGTTTAVKTTTTSETITSAERTASPTGTAESTGVVGNSTFPAFTGRVESSSQPGFGFLVSLVSFIVLTLLVRERQRL